MSSMAVPKLRFRDSGGREFPEWESNRIEDITEFVKNGFSYKWDLNRTHKYRVTRIESISSGKINVAKLGSVEHVDSKYLLKDGDILLSHINSLVYIGNCAIYHKYMGPIYHGMNLLNIRANSMVSSAFLYYLLKTEKFSKTVKKNAQQAVNQCSISTTTLKNFVVLVPSLPEQQKITDFLTAYDTMIDTQTKRVEAMKVRKQGLLQKIFSQEIRFKDNEGREFPEWEEKKLGEVILRKSTTAFSNISLPGVEYEDIISGTGRLNKDVALKGISKKGILFDVGDVLYGKLRPYLKNWLLPDFSGIAIGDFWVLNSKHMVAGYIYYLIQSPEFSKVANTSIGTKMPRADWSLVSAYLVGVPSLPEQQKIADFLTAVDKQLEVEEKRLETMKTIKKGLLQQMFV